MIIEKIPEPFQDQHPMPLENFYARLILAFFTDIAFVIIENSLNFVGWVTSLWKNKNKYFHKAEKEAWICVELWRGRR